MYHKSTAIQLSCCLFLLNGLEHGDISIGIVYDCFIFLVSEKDNSNQ